MDDVQADLDATAQLVSDDAAVASTSAEDVAAFCKSERSRT